MTQFLVLLQFIIVKLTLPPALLTILILSVLILKILRRVVFNQELAQLFLVVSQQQGLPLPLFKL